MYFYWGFVVILDVRPFWRFRFSATLRQFCLLFLRGSCAGNPLSTDMEGAYDLPGTNGGCVVGAGACLPSGDDTSTTQPPAVPGSP